LFQKIDEEDDDDDDEEDDANVDNDGNPVDGEPKKKKKKVTVSFEVDQVQDLTPTILLSLSDTHTLHPFLVSHFSVIN